MDYFALVNEMIDEIEKGLDQNEGWELLASRYPFSKQHIYRTFKALNG